MDYIFRFRFNLDIQREGGKYKNKESVCTYKCMCDKEGGCA